MIIIWSFDFNSSFNKLRILIGLSDKMISCFKSLPLFLVLVILIQLSFIKCFLKYLLEEQSLRKSFSNAWRSCTNHSIHHRVFLCIHHCIILFISLSFESFLYPVQISIAKMLQLVFLFDISACQSWASDAAIVWHSWQLWVDEQFWCFRLLIFFIRNMCHLLFSFSLDDFFKQLWRTNYRSFNELLVMRILHFLGRSCSLKFDYTRIRN